MPIPQAETRDAALHGDREIEQIPCPVERVKAINRIVRQVGTIPGPLARVRIAALLEALKTTKTVTELARQVGMKRSRVSTLVNHPAVTPVSTLSPAAAGGR